MKLTAREHSDVIERAKQEADLRTKMDYRPIPVSANAERQRKLNRALRFYRRFYRRQRSA